MTENVRDVINLSEMALGVSGRRKFGMFFSLKRHWILMKFTKRSTYLENNGFRIQFTKTALPEPLL